MQSMSAELLIRLYDLYENTTDTLPKIAKKLGIVYSTAHKYIKEKYSAEYRSKRRRKLHSVATKGKPNGRVGNKHPRYNGGMYWQKFATSKTPYLMCLKPCWYTGAANTRYIPYHNVIVCIDLNITEIPVGFVVHHCDMDHGNNDISNLVLLTKSDHNSLHHCLLKSATTMSKDSTLKWLAEARGFKLSIYANLLKFKHDIVYTIGEPIDAGKAAGTE